MVNSQNSRNKKSITHPRRESWLETEAGRRLQTQSWTLACTRRGSRPQKRWVQRPGNLLSASQRSLIRCVPTYAYLFILLKSTSFRSKSRLCKCVAKGLIRVVGMPKVPTMPTKVYPSLACIAFFWRLQNLSNSASYLLFYVHSS